ncbi:MAG: helix-turn-helix transcriptional regulator [Synergistaceae bacterium]|nr:helix-turn-helix transcriptional regulator [Synergistaceae bacterium]
MRLYENTNLTELLKTARLESELSQEQLAKKIGCTRETVCKIENGRDEPKYRIFYRWLNACGKQLIVRSYKTVEIDIDVK